MGRVYKKVARKTDPATGEVTEHESEKYYVEYLDENRKKRRKAASPDKSVANRKLAQLERDVDRNRNGQVDPYGEHRRRLITDHLQDYEKNLRSKGNSEKHVKQVIKRATDVMTCCNLVWPSDIRPAAIQNHLHDLRQKGRSLQTCNFYLQAAKQFVRWMVQNSRMLESPIRGLSRMNVRVDRRHDRRPSSEDEFGFLLEAAIVGKRIEGITGWTCPRKVARGKAKYAKP